jgi:hypothetical protein
MRGMVIPAITTRSAIGTLPLLLLAGLIGIASALVQASPILLAATAGLCSILIIAIYPALGAYAWLLVGPLIVGIPRGDGVLVLRPNEGMLLVVVAGIGLRALWHMLRGESFFPRRHPVDTAVLLLVVTGSVLPVLLRFGRGLPLTTDDILYAMVFVKYAILYFLFRCAITTEDQVGICLRLALIAGVAVGLIAIFQVANVPGVADFLNNHYDSPFEGAVGPSTLRGSSTVASSFGLADMMAICLAMVLVWRGASRRLLLAAGGLVFLAGSIAAGSFSGVLGLVVVVVAAGLMTRRLMAQMAIMIPTFGLAVAAIWPVVATRLDGFQSYQGLPRSWIGRLANLERFFWPEVFSGFNWLLGVRPAARVAAPEMWRQWVYIESGHTWLLWTGGTPLLLAFFFFSWVIFRDLRRIALRDDGLVAVAAAASFAAALMIFVLMLFDAHLTVRGTADLFFPLIALAVVSPPIPLQTRPMLRWDANPALRYPG